MARRGAGDTKLDDRRLVAVISIHQKIDYHASVVSAPRITLCHRFVVDVVHGPVV